MLNAPLRTPRLVLEPLLGAHADALFPILWDPATWRWIAAPKARTLDELRARWQRNESRTSPDGSAAWLGWAVRLGDAYIGKLDVTVEGRVAANVGYVFAPEQWGKGYATEAVGAIVTHLVGQGVTELRATVTVGNDASARVLERLGFTCAGILPENDVIRGVTRDDWVYVRVA